MTEIGRHVMRHHWFVWFGRERVVVATPLFCVDWKRRVVGFGIWPVWWLDGFKEGDIVYRWLVRLW